MSVLTTKEIMEIIPHRHPFLLIDTIEELVPGLRAVGKKCVTFDEPYFAGHFPGISNAKFKKKVVPGDVLVLETEIIKVKGPIGVGKATATVDGKIAATAELTFAIGSGE